MTEEIVEFPASRESFNKSRGDAQYSKQQCSLRQSSWASSWHWWCRTRRPQAAPLTPRSLLPPASSLSSVSPNPLVAFSVGVHQHQRTSEWGGPARTLWTSLAARSGRASFLVGRCQWPQAFKLPALHPGALPAQSASRQTSAARRRLLLPAGSVNERCSRATSAAHWAPFVMAALLCRHRGWRRR